MAVVYFGHNSTGLRNDEIKSRMNKAFSVCNEILLHLKATESSNIQLGHMKIQSNACFDGKVIFGFALSNKLSGGQAKELISLKMNLLKAY